MLAVSLFDSKNNTDYDTLYLATKSGLECLFAEIITWFILDEDDSEEIRAHITYLSGRYALPDYEITREELEELSIIIHSVLDRLSLRIFTVEQTSN